MKICQEELKQKKLNDQNLRLAIREVRETGFVILEKVFSDTWVEKMHHTVDQFAHDQPPGEDHPTRRGSIILPMTLPYLDPMIIANPWGIQIITAIMGKDIIGQMPIHTNSSWPGATIQHIHRDSAHLFLDFPIPLPPATLIIHIPLVDFTEENGSTEAWPGSHLILDNNENDLNDKGIAAGSISEQRAAQLPSVRTNMPAGSVLVRDMRLWHRAMPNNGDQIRTMLSLVYFHQLHRYPDHLQFPPIPEETVSQMSEKARHIYRHSLEQFNLQQKKTGVVHFAK